MLSILQTEDVLAAQAIGMKNDLVSVRHVLPNTLSYAIVAATLAIPGCILAESGLSLIDLGIRQPEASWGNRLEAAMDMKPIKCCEDALDRHGVQKMG